MVPPTDRERCQWWGGGVKSLVRVWAVEAMAIEMTWWLSCWVTCQEAGSRGRVEQTCHILLHEGRCNYSTISTNPSYSHHYPISQTSSVLQLTTHPFSLCLPPSPLKRPAQYSITYRDLGSFLRLQPNSQRTVHAVVDVTSYGYMTM